MVTCCVIAVDLGVGDESKSRRARNPFTVKHLGKVPTGIPDPAPARDIAVVLGQGLGEDMSARAVGDEVEILGRQRI